MKTDLHHRWLRWKRHLRSCAVSDRALRDADRALAAAAANAAAVALAIPSRGASFVDRRIVWRPSRLALSDIVFLNRRPDGATEPWQTA